MWELAANWHRKKQTHTKKLCQATAKHVYFGIIYKGQGVGAWRGDQPGGGTGRGGGGRITDYFQGNLFVQICNHSESPRGILCAL